MRKVHFDIFRLLCCDNSHEVIKVQKNSESNIIFYTTNIKPQFKLLQRK